MSSQIAFAILWTIGYVVWSLLYYRVVDPLVRHAAGAVVGVPVVWVQ